MSLKYLIITCVVTTAFLDVARAVCLNVPTSSGIKNLADNEYACKALASGESSADLGKNFWQCVAGSLRSFDCLTLRWDQKNQVCNWAQLSSCDSDPPTTSAPSGVTQTTTPPPVKCSAENCKPPSCYCFGDKPNMALEDIPQFAMITFDDAVTSPVYSAIYQKLLFMNYWNVYNPNNCSIKSTFFMTHTYTDYSLVQSLYNSGHEIADHTTNHVSNTEVYSEIAAEIVGLRDIVANKTTVKAQDIKGFRAPYLKIMGDNQYNVLRDNNFTYDSSLTNIEIQANRPPLWPFTLDYAIDDNKCPNRPCPVKPHPGLWEIPMNSWVGSNGFSCAMIDGCAIKDNDFNGTVAQFLAFYKNNFNKFNAHKVPMNIFNHASMFMKYDTAFEAFGLFLQELAEKKVWFVTPSQLIYWMQNPISNKQLAETTFTCISAEL